MLLGLDHIADVYSSSFRRPMPLLHHPLTHNGGNRHYQNRTYSQCIPVHPLPRSPEHCHNLTGILTSHYNPSLLTQAHALQLPQNDTI